MIRHMRSIEKTGEADDTEYAVSCSCRTFYLSRLTTRAAALNADAEHKAHVTSGVWQIEQDASSDRLNRLAPEHNAIRALQDAKEALNSAAFGVIIARQKGGDVASANAILASAKNAKELAQRELNTF